MGDIAAGLRGNAEGEGDGSHVTENTRGAPLGQMPGNMRSLQDLSRGLSPPHVSLGPQGVWAYQ